MDIFCHFFKKMEDESSPPEEVRERVKVRKSIYGERHVPTELPKYQNIKFGKCIGHGHFSHVYMGIYNDRLPVAIKLIERGDKNLINNEISILQELNGESNIIQLYEAHRDQYTVLVFELVESIDLLDLFERITVNQVRILIYKILKGLVAAHSHGIVHRDIKFDNILVTANLEEVKIIDWGCGGRLVGEMQTSAGARLSRPPEMLLDDTHYGAGCDVWAVGIFILDILTAGKVPWRGKSRQEVLVQLSRYYGTDGFDLILERAGHGYPRKVDPSEFSKVPEVDIIQALDPSMCNLFDSKLLDLMFKLLVVDPRERITSKQALDHPFFEPLRNRN